MIEYLYHLYVLGICLPEYYVVACGDWHLGPSPSHHIHRLCHYYYYVCTTSASTSTGTTDSTHHKPPGGDDHPALTTDLHPSLFVETYPGYCLDGAAELPLSEP